MRALVLCLLFLASPVLAQELTPKEIVKRSDDLMRGDTQKGPFRMTVVTPQWTRILEIYVHSKGRDRMLIKILSPAKEKGTTTLRIGSEMWNYLPSVERTIKIPPSMMLQPWMGSDFANDDLVKESSVVDDYDHRLVAEKMIDGHVICKIELVPKSRAGVIWEKRVQWIQKDDFTPVREAFVGKNNKVIKILTYSDKKMISGRVIPTRWEMVSEVKEGHRTVIEVTDKVVYNESIEDGVFSLKSLKE